MNRLFRKLQNRIGKHYRNVAAWPDKLAYKWKLKSVDELTLPDFLGIGAQKAGTTWLDRNLQKHPEVFIPGQRYEIQYFHKNFHWSLNTYAEYFREGRELVKGEVMPGYGLISVRRIKLIRDLIPNLKLFYIMRDPIERAWSHARMTLANDDQTENGEISIERIRKHYTSRISRIKSDYLTVIDNWTSVFGRDALLICFQDEITDKPEALMNRVVEHIGVSRIDDFSTYPIRKQINRGSQSELPTECAVELSQMYKEMLVELRRRFGDPIDKWMRKYGI